MRVAIVEDDLDQAKLLGVWLEEAGYECSYFVTGAAIIDALQKERFDLVLLDWLLPDINGDQVLRWIREQMDWHIPVIFVTQCDDEKNIAYALDNGADDYVLKPIKPLELKARIQALTRRIGGVDKTRRQFECGIYRFDLDSHQVFVNNDAAGLTQREFELALFFFRNVGRLLTRAHLLESVWGHTTEINTRTLDTHVSRLRKKLLFDDQSAWQLKSIYHHGYRLEDLS